MGSAPSAQKVKNFLRASREEEISFLEGGESLEVSVIFKCCSGGIWGGGAPPGISVTCALPPGGSGGAEPPPGISEWRYPCLSPADRSTDSEKSKNEPQASY